MFLVSLCLFITMFAELNLSNMKLTFTMHLATLRDE